MNRLVDEFCEGEKIALLATRSLQALARHLASAELLELSKRIKANADMIENGIEEMRIATMSNVKRIIKEAE